jgi:hypothetical protein
MQRGRTIEGADGRAIFGKRSMKLIGQDQSIGAGHVDDGDGRLPRNVLAEESGNRSSIEIRAATT